MKLRCCLIYETSTGRMVPVEAQEQALRSRVTAVVHSYIRRVTVTERLSPATGTERRGL